MVAITMQANAKVYENAGRAQRTSVFCGNEVSLGASSPSATTSFRRFLCPNPTVERLNMLAVLVIAVIKGVSESLIGK
jgi:hypothetical protein